MYEQNSLNKGLKAFQLNEGNGFIYFLHSSHNIEFVEESS